MLRHVVALVAVATITTLSGERGRTTQFGEGDPIAEGEYTIESLSDVQGTILELLLPDNPSPSNPFQTVRHLYPTGKPNERWNLIRVSPGSEWFHISNVAQPKVCLVAKNYPSPEGHDGKFVMAAGCSSIFSEENWRFQKSDADTHWIVINQLSGEALDVDAGTPVGGGYQTKTPNGTAYQNFWLH